MKKNLAYKPTKAEEKLLEVLVNPEHKQKNVSEICEIADISQRHYYDIFKKQEFIDLYKKTSFELVKQSILPVINAVVKEAKDGSFQHAKLILEMANMYTEKQKVEHSGGLNNTNTELSSEERKKRIAELKKKLLKS